MIWAVGPHSSFHALAVSFRAPQDDPAKRDGAGRQATYRIWPLHQSRTFLRSRS
jgi:hypothetical protein